MAEPIYTWEKWLFRFVVTVFGLTAVWVFLALLMWRSGDKDAVTLIKSQATASASAIIRNLNVNLEPSFYSQVEAVAAASQKDNFHGDRAGSCEWLGRNECVTFSGFKIKVLLKR